MSSAHRSAPAVLGIFLLLASIAGCGADSLVSPEQSSSTGIPQRLDGRTAVIESGPGEGGLGTCEAGGRWRNPAGRLAGAVPHAACVVADVEGFWALTSDWPLHAADTRNKLIHLAQSGRTATGFIYLTDESFFRLPVTATVTRRGIELDVLWPETEERYLRYVAKIHRGTATGTLCEHHLPSYEGGAARLCGTATFAQSAYPPGLLGYYYEPLSWDRWNRIAWSFTTGQLQEVYMANQTAHVGPHGVSTSGSTVFLTAPETLPAVPELELARPADPPTILRVTAGIAAADGPLVWWLSIEDPRTSESPQWGYWLPSGNALFRVRETGPLPAVEHFSPYPPAP